MSIGSPTEVVPSSPGHSPSGGGALPDVEGPLLPGQSELVPGHGQAEVDNGLLDRAYNHPPEQGMGTLELAAQELDDSGPIAKQICDELGVPCPSYLTEAVREWIQDAKKEARLYQRASGAFSGRMAAAIPTDKGEGAGASGSHRRAREIASWRKALSLRQERAGYKRIGSQN